MSTQTNSDTAVVQFNPAQLADFNLTEAGMSELHEKYNGIVFANLSTVKGMDQAKKDVAAVRVVRTGIEKLRKDKNQAEQAIIAARNTTAKLLTERLEALEVPMKDQIDKEVARKEKIAADAAAAEEKRIADIRARIVADFTTSHVGVSCKSVEEVKALLDAVSEMAITEEAYADLQHEAAFAKEGAVVTLRARYDNAVARDAEIKERKATEERNRVEAESLAAMRAEMALEQKRLDDAAAKLANDRAALVAEQVSIAAANVPVAPAAAPRGVFMSLVPAAKPQSKLDRLMADADEIFAKSTAAAAPTETVVLSDRGILQAVADHFGLTPAAALAILRTVDWFSEEFEAVA